MPYQTEHNFDSQIDGVNQTFTIPNTSLTKKPGFQWNVFYNGQQIDDSAVQDDSDTTFTLLSHTPQVGEKLHVSYQDKLVEVIINCVQNGIIRPFLLPLEGELEDTLIVGAAVATSQNITGELEVLNITGDLTEVEQLNGDISELIAIEGTLDC